MKWDFIAEGGREFINRAVSSYLIEKKNIHIVKGRPYHPIDHKEVMKGFM